MLEIPFKEVPESEIENTSGFYHIRIENEKDPSKNREHYFKNEMYRDLWYSILNVHGGYLNMKLTGVSETPDIVDDNMARYFSNTHMKLYGVFDAAQTPRQYDGVEILKKPVYVSDIFFVEGDGNGFKSKIGKVSRAIFLDMNGSPSPLVVQPNETMTVTYVVKFIFPSSINTLSTTFSVNGETITGTLTLSKNKSNSSNIMDEPFSITNESHLQIIKDPYSLYTYAPFGKYEWDLGLVPCIGTQEIPFDKFVKYPAYDFKIKYVSDRKIEVHLTAEHLIRLADQSEVIMVDRYWLKYPLYGNINFSKPFRLVHNSKLVMKFVIPYYID